MPKTLLSSILALGLIFLTGCTSKQETQDAICEGALSHVAWLEEELEEEEKLRKNSAEVANDLFDAGVEIFGKNAGLLVGDVAFQRNVNIIQIKKLISQNVLWDQIKFCFSDLWIQKSTDFVTWSEDPENQFWMDAASKYPQTWDERAP
jgi:hypothetical protein